MKTITSNTIAKLIHNSLEDTTTPTLIIQTLQEYNNKPLTTRHEKILKEQVNPTCTIRKQYGMTHIDWENQQEHGSLLIAYHESHVQINTDWIIEKNPAYFQAREERNQKRHTTLANNQTIDNLAEAINTYNQAYKQLNQILKYEGDFCPDRHTIETKLLENPL